MNDTPTIGGRFVTHSADELDVAIGANLRRLRQQHGLSLAAIGRVVDTTYQQVQKYEQGRNRLSARSLYLLARSFEVDVSAFFDGLETAEPEMASEALACQLGRIQRDRPKVAKTLFELTRALGNTGP